MTVKKTRLGVYAKEFVTKNVLDGVSMQNRMPFSQTSAFSAGKKPPINTTTEKTLADTVAAQEWNELVFLTTKHIDLSGVSDGEGDNLITYKNCFIKISAIDLGDPAKFLEARGWVGELNIIPKITVISSNGLSLGTITANGAVPIVGGSSVANVRVLCELTPIDFRSGE
jgi:hypothetical protein